MALAITPRRTRLLRCTKILSSFNTPSSNRAYGSPVHGFPMSFIVRHTLVRKSKTWLFREYWNNTERKHIFAVKTKTRKGLEKVYQVVRICSIGIRRHIKIKAAANPYAPEFSKYFWTRRHVKESKLLPALSSRDFRAQFT